MLKIRAKVRDTSTLIVSRLPRDSSATSFEYYVHDGPKPTFFARGLDRALTYALQVADNRTVECAWQSQPITNKLLREVKKKNGKKRFPRSR